MRTFKTQFFLLVAFQLLLLLSLIGYKQYTLRTGERLLFRSLPVDPRDLFRGDYVILRYSFSELDSVDLHDKNYSFLTEWRKGETIYVALRQEGRFWESDHVSRTPPEDSVFLRGVVKRVIYALPPNYNTPRIETSIPGATKTKDVDKITVEYGIESYFVEQGTGRALEDIQRQPNMALIVEASVDRQGRAIVRGVHPEKVSANARRDF